MSQIQEQAQATNNNEVKKPSSSEKCTCSKRLVVLEKQVLELRRKLELFEKVLKGRK